MTVTKRAAGWFGPVQTAIPVGLPASSINTLLTPLAANASDTGEWEQVDAPDVAVSCKSDVDGTLFMDFSNDAVNVDTFPAGGFEVLAGIHEFHTAVKGPRYYRIRFQNGASPQSEFRAYSYYGTFRQANSPLNAAIQQDSDAVTVRAITEELAIASGLFTGYSIVNKFGTNGDIDTASVPEDIWEGGGVYAGFPDSAVEAVEVLSSSADDASAGTGARTIRITGLDSNYDVASETITLNGTSPVDSVNTYRRVHTASVLTAGSGGVNAGTITVRHTTTTTNVFLSMQIGRNQTNCSGYTVPAGYTAYLRQLHCAIRGTAQANTPGAVEGNIWTRPFGGVFRSRRPFAASSNAPLNDVIYGGLTFTEKSDIVIRITASSGDNASVSGGYDLILVRN